jgi:hypothetical protein
MFPSTQVLNGPAKLAEQCWTAEFERVLPRIRLHACITLRHVRCSHQREELIAEVVALSWKWWMRLCRRGKHPEGFVSAIAVYAVRAVRDGRRLCGQESKDVLSPLAQRRRGFTVGSMSNGSMCSELLEEALTDNTRTPVTEQASFRVDFPAWLRTHTARSRKIIADLMIGERTSDVSLKYGTTPSRVSQLRQEFRCDWNRFVDAPA